VKLGVKVKIQKNSLHREFVLFLQCLASFQVANFLFDFCIAVLVWWGEGPVPIDAPTLVQQLGVMFAVKRVKISAPPTNPECYVLGYDFVT